MSTFLCYFSYEWRKNRVALGYCALITGALALWETSFFDAYSVSHSPVALFGMAQAAVLYLLAVGCGLLAPGESTAPAFFDRLPRGLNTSFFARVSFYFVGLACALACGFLLIWLASIWRVGEAPLPPIQVKNVALIAASFAAWAGWTLVASAWVPRAALALPLGLLQLLLFTLPYATLWRSLKVEFLPACLFFASMALASLPAAWVTFRSARSTNARPFRGVFMALAIGVFVAAPSWGFLAWSIHVPARLGIQDRFGISTVAFSEDGSRVLARIDPMRRWQYALYSWVYTLNIGEGLFQSPEQDVYPARGLLIEDKSLFSQSGSGTLYYSSGVQPRRERHYVDLRRSMERSHSQVFGEIDTGWSRVWISDTWLLWSEETAAFWLYDPTTETREPLPWPAPTKGGSYPRGVILADGRFLHSWGKNLHLGDPRTGEWEQVETPSGQSCYGVRQLHSQVGSEVLGGRPVLVQFDSGAYFFEGSKLVPGPCLEGHPSAYVIDYRETESARQFLWWDLRPPQPVHPFHTDEIWLSDVDTNESWRIFPPTSGDELR